MMFSKELENLIQATLEDGVLEDYEKAALIKRAQAEGVDLTELEIYINSILQKRKKELDEEKNVQNKKKAQEMKDAFGQVCPNCGKQVPPMTLKCECGYEFTKAKANSSVQELVDKIEHISMDCSSITKREKQICDAIELFPVPNTKEDILEFISLATSNLKNKVPFYSTFVGKVIIYTVAIVMSAGWFLIIGYFLGWFKNFNESEGILRERRQKAWQAKFDQILLKGRSLRGDSDFQKQLDYYESVVNKK